MANYTELLTNPATGRPFGEQWFDIAQYRGQSGPTVPAYTPAQVQPQWSAQSTPPANRFGGITLNAAETGFANHPAILQGYATANRVVAPGNWLQNAWTNLPAGQDYLSYLGSELLGYDDYIRATTAQPEAPDLEQEIRFDAARYGTDLGDTRRRVERAMSTVNTAPGPAEQQLDAWDPTVTSAYASATTPANIGGFTTLMPHQAAEANSARLYGDINSLLHGAGYGTLAGAFEAEIANRAQALQEAGQNALIRNLTGGQRRRLAAGSGGAVPLSALKGDEYATHYSGAPQKGHKGRIT